MAAALARGADAAYQAVLTPVEGTILTVVRESAAGRADGRPATAPSLAAVLPAARDAGRVALGPHARSADRCWRRRRGRRRRRRLPAAARRRAARGGRRAAARAAGGDGAGRRAFDAVAASAGGELDVSELRYEVMFLCDLVDERHRDFKQRWGDDRRLDRRRRR